MSELSNSLLEQLIDCQESDIPSTRVIQLMASEIMRVRGYGEMVPAPEEELRQRSILLLRAILDDEKLNEAFKRLGEVLKNKLSNNAYETTLEALRFVIGENPMGDEGNWVEVDTQILKDAEAVIHDSIGFGKSRSHVNHNNALNNLRKFIENAGGQSRTLAPRNFLEDVLVAIEEVTYGKQYSMVYREKMAVKFCELLGIDPEERL